MVLHSRFSSDGQLVRMPFQGILSAAPEILQRQQASNDKHGHLDKQIISLVVSERWLCWIVHAAHPYLVTAAYILRQQQLP